MKKIIFRQNFWFGAEATAPVLTPLWYHVLLVELSKCYGLLRQELVHSVTDRTYTCVSSTGKLGHRSEVLHHTDLQRSERQPGGAPSGPVGGAGGVQCSPCKVGHHT